MENGHLYRYAIPFFILEIAFVLKSALSEINIATLASQVALVVKNPPSTAGDIRVSVQSLGWEDPLEEGTAAHSSVLAWRIPWTEEPGGLQCMGLQRVGHD